MSGKHKNSRRRPFETWIVTGTEIERAQEIAAAWRAQRSDACREEGFVVVFDGEITGWTRHISDDSASGYVSGALAVSVGGDLFLAVGGDYYNGAERWEQVTP